MRCQLLVSNDGFEKVIFLRLARRNCVGLHTELFVADLLCPLPPMMTPVPALAHQQEDRWEIPDGCGK